MPTFCVLLYCVCVSLFFFFFFQAEDGIRDIGVTGVQTCALPICVTLFRNRIALSRCVPARYVSTMYSSAAPTASSKPWTSLWVVALLSLLAQLWIDRKSVVYGKSVDLRGRRIIRKRTQ